MLALKRFLALAAFVSAPVWAMPQATVDAVVSPAWLERAGREQPLAPGMEIRSGDRIRTGGGARAYLKLAEGSTVKLGENAKFAFFSRSIRPQSMFKGLFDVAAGAFRFTTDALRKVKAREVSIRVGTATVGIRGTDVWGKTDAARDLVMLIDGRIEIDHASGRTIEMAQPMTAFVAPKDGTQPAVEPVTPEDFKARARETEIEAGDGAARARGKWRLLLGQHATEAAALEQYDIARSEGFGVRIAPRQTDGGWSYEVAMKGFADEAEAAKTAVRLKAATGIEATATK